MKNQIFIAFDFYDWKLAQDLAHRLKGSGCGIKVGMELFYAQGIKAVEQFHQMGFPIFLDLKLHDIPNTVAQGLAQLFKLPAHIYNVHASGGSEMLRRSFEAWQQADRKDAKLIAVTQLTSTTESMMNQELLVAGSLEQCVLSYARMALQAGLHGVVCSAHEVVAIKKTCGHSFLCVTPGIRSPLEASHDQKRVMTAQQALSLGADYLVVGRSITQATDPMAALESLLGDHP